MLQWGRNHQVDVWFALEGLERADEINIISDVSFFDPSLPTVIGAKHDDDDVRI